MRKFGKGAFRRFYLFGSIVSTMAGSLAYMSVKSIGLQPEDIQVLADTILFDSDNRMITATDEGSISKKWDGKYYLKIK